MHPRIARLVTMPRASEAMRWFRLAADQGYWNGGKGLQLLIAYEFLIKPILVRVCGERYLAINIIIN